MVKRYKLWVNKEELQYLMQIVPIIKGAKDKKEATISHLRRQFEILNNAVESAEKAESAERLYRDFWTYPEDEDGEPTCFIDVPGHTEIDDTVPW